MNRHDPPNPPPRIAALVVAAGRGARAGSPDEAPKQYRRLGRDSVLARAVNAFLDHPSIAVVRVVIHADDGALCQAALGLPRAGVATCHGGVSRQDSVRLGLEALGRDAPDIVLIHDAARPFVSARLIERTIAAVGEGVGALPAVPVTDTLKRGQDGVVAATVERGGLWAAQTPQGFFYRDIVAAHEKAHRAGGGRTFTDDASIAEWAGLTVRLVEGEPENGKLTTARDIERARAILGESDMTDVRTGNGYDVHRLVAGSAVTLCGVRIAHDQALDGHSDADVGLHALTDALLATCGAGDIGDHFPPSDPTWRGAASSIFVEHAVSIVAAAGGRICNADISLICEAPRIAPHREAMRQAVAAMTGLSLERVSVKATTNETIGFVGRREGIAAIATATVVFAGRHP